DAVVGRSQRGLLVGRARRPLPARGHRSRLPLPGGERGRAGEGSGVAAQHHAAADRRAQAVAGLRPRHDRVPPAPQPGGARLPARVARRDAAGRRQPLGAHAARRARSRRPRGRPARRDAQPQSLSRRGACALLPEPRPARLLLVPARAARPAARPLWNRRHRDLGTWGGPPRPPPPPPPPRAPGDPRRPPPPPPHAAPALPPPTPPPPPRPRGPPPPPR